MFKQSKKYSTDGLFRGIILYMILKLSAHPLSGQKIIFEWKNEFFKGVTGYVR